MLPQYQTVTPVKIAQGEINTSISTLYTVPEGTVTLMKTIDVTNSTANPISFSLWMVPGGDTPALANALYASQPVEGFSNFQWSAVQVLNTTETIQVQATDVGLAINISGGEAT
jgi:hypothetical protein